MREVIGLEPTVSPLKPGDTVSMTITVKRKWYELWKPKWRSERQRFRVI